jgi:hypothetical protein
MVPDDCRVRDAFGRFETEKKPQVPTVRPATAYSSTMFVANDGTPCTSREEMIQYNRDLLR